MPCVLSCWAWEDKTEDFINMNKYLGRGDVRKTETDCSVTSERTRGNRHQLKYEKFHLKLKKNPEHCYCKGGWKHIVQRDCGVSVFGCIQHLIGQGPEEAAVNDPNLCTRSGKGDLMMALPTSTVKKHCNIYQKQFTYVQLSMQWAERLMRWPSDVLFHPTSYSTVCIQGSIHKEYLFSPSFPLCLDENLSYVLAVTQLRETILAATPNIQLRLP